MGYQRHRDGGTVTSGATVPLRRRHEGKLPASRFRGSDRRLIRVAYFVKSIRESHVSGINCRVALQRALVARETIGESISGEESRKEGGGEERKKKRKKKCAKGRGDNEIAIATRRRRVSSGNSMHKRRV